MPAACQPQKNVTLHCTWIDEKKGAISPLFISFCRRFVELGLLAVRGEPIQRPDDLGFEFENMLLDGALDARAVPGGNVDRTIVLARGQFDLHEDMGAFQEPVRQLDEAFAESADVMPLGLFFPFIVLVLPGFLGRDREFCDRSAIRQIFGFGIPADESGDRKLIEVH